MKVLVACEESQRVCMAFREKGHESYSCDLQQCSGGHPEWHILGDAMRLLNPRINCGINVGIVFETMDGHHHLVGQWDLIIAHPPCTYLSNAGAARLYKRIDGKSFVDLERLNKGLDAKEFFTSFLNAGAKMVAVENPLPSKVYRLPKYTQIIQPYYFGDPYSKKTCLWLKNLPQLRPTQVVEPLCSWVSGGQKRQTERQDKTKVQKLEIARAEVRRFGVLQEPWQNNGVKYYELY